MEPIIIMMERASHVEGYENIARVILFDTDPLNGARSVRDIIEGTPWRAVEIALEQLVSAKLVIDTEDGLKDITKLTQFSTKRACIKNVLIELENRYKTGLDIGQPKSVISKLRSVLGQTYGGPALGYEKGEFVFYTWTDAPSGIIVHARDKDLRVCISKLPKRFGG